MLNTEVFELVSKYHKKILVVTKYWDFKKTTTILWEAQEKYSEVFYGLWENRINSLQEKKLKREDAHFIGNIQSREIKNIVQYCFIIHSLDNLKHAEKIENQDQKTQAFLQIKLDEQKDIWVLEEEISSFLDSCKNYKNLEIIWISGMWAGDVWEREKREEFRKLISLRDTYLPNGLISAGTSRDYQIALEEWIDIVRIGSSAVV